MERHDINNEHDNSKNDLFCFFLTFFFSNRRLFCDNNYTPPCIDIGEAKRNSRISSARRRQHSAFGISSLECPAVFCSKTLPKDEEGPSVLPSPCSSEASRPFNCLLISNVSTIVQFSQFTEPFNPYRYFSFFLFGKWWFSTADD